ncbi:MAG: amidase [Planctomycetales bacterium]|nr:amidase [Planctomycetales bacterium]
MAAPAFDGSIQQIAACLRRRDITPLDLVEHCLARIERYDATIRAWVVVDADRARSEAEQLGKELREGEDRGPLHGIPFGVKDIIDVAGFPTRAGSVLTSATPATADAPVVARLRAAGAIVLGKTVTCEWACFDPSPTRNPWNHDRTPGGSSSGSAAAVACGMCVAALGSQTGGSVTRPAAYCGVVGFKPAHGAISLAGVVPVSPRLDHVGIFARNVDDASIVLSVCMSGGDRYTKSHDEDSVANQRFRIARPAQYFLACAAPEVAETVERAMEKLAPVASIESFELPASFSNVHAMHRRIMAHDAAVFHAGRYAGAPGEFGPNVAALIEEGLSIGEASYQAAIAHQEQFTTEMATIADRFDALLTPATPTVAPVLETTGDPRFNSPWSYCGLPTIGVPAGIHAGLPIGLQLVGQHATRLAAIGRELEARVRFTLKPVT